MNMTSATSGLLVVTCLLLLMSVPGIAGDLESLTGTWNGPLEVSPGKVLDVSIIIEEAPADSVAGAFRIIGSGDMPIDRITVQDDSVTFVVQGSFFQVIGTVDHATETIHATLHQGENAIPLLLTRNESAKSVESKE